MRLHDRQYRAFTLIELLVVIAVIGLLIGVMALVGSRLLTSQKARYTEQIMKNTTIAIDQFAEVNPSKRAYDRRTLPSFGPLPSYMLEALSGRTEANAALETTFPDDPETTSDDGVYSYTFEDRLRRDFGGGQSGNYYDYQGDADIGNHDMRSLFVHLNSTVPDAVATIPQDALKPLRSQAEYFSAAGDAGNTNSDSRFDILGIHDAWGVPLDYFLNVKIDPASGGGWKVVDRMPVLRSLGVTKDEANVGAAPPEAWIFSQNLPKPFASVDESGNIANLGDKRQAAGWFRARAAGHQDQDKVYYYGYLPEQDDQ
jgi:prepilin-type N-terminal cleavage/methylation domain-containing protein